jgi:hypothetical protein
VVYDGAHNGIKEIRSFKYGIDCINMLLIYFCGIIVGTTLNNGIKFSNKKKDSTILLIITKSSRNQ